MDDDLQKYKRALGRAVREQRETCGLTKQCLALMAGTNRLTLRRIETGEANPTLDVLLKIAGGLGVSLGDLIPPTETDVGQ